MGPTEVVVCWEYMAGGVCNRQEPDETCPEFESQQADEEEVSLGGSGGLGYAGSEAGLRFKVYFFWRFDV